MVISEQVSAALDAYAAASKEFQASKATYDAANAASRDASDRMNTAWQKQIDARQHLLNVLDSKATG